MSMLVWNSARAILSASLIAVSLAGCGSSSLSDIVGAPEQSPALAAAAPPATVGAIQAPVKAVKISAGAVAAPKIASSSASDAKKDASAPSATAQSDDRAAARKAAEALVAVAVPGSDAYRIGPQDVIDVAVFKVPELSKTVQVADNGMVSYPLIGQARVGGATAREIEQDFEKKLGSKYLQSPQITVSVKEYNSQRVTLDGAVKKPGVYALRGRLTLLQAVAQAGGLESSADSTLVIFRDAAGKQSAAKFNLDEIRAGTAPDPTLQPGDVVVAGTSAIKEALGNVLKALPLASVFALL